MRTIKVTSGPLAGRTLTLDTELVIGRQGADLTIDDPELSRRHAVLRPVPEGVEVEDLGSTNGTLVDGDRIDAAVTITEDGVVELGDTSIEVEVTPDPEEEPPAATPPPAVPRMLLRVLTGTAPGTLVPVSKDPFVIGRGEAGMGMLDGDPELSRKHAHVSMVDERVVVEDLGSTNGTLVNGHEIAAPTVLKPGDKMSVGTTSLELVELPAKGSSGAMRATSSAIGRVRSAETTLLDNLAELVYHKPKQVLAGTAVFFLVAVFFGAPVVGLLGSHPRPDPAAESSIAVEDIESASGRKLGIGLLAMVRSGDVDSPAARRKVERVVRTMKEEPAVAQVFDFYSTRDPALVSKDRKSTYVGGQFKDLDIKEIDDAGEELTTELEKQDGVLLGGSDRVGPAVGETVGEDIGKAEGLAFPLLLIASLFVFRGFVAALLPLYVGILTVFATFLALRIVNGAITEVSVFALNMVIALGLGLAIDYSLFIVSRYREELQGSEPGLEPIRRTLKTAGRTVIFSALTVAAALGCLILFPQSFVYSMGLGGALCSLIAMVVALTALPALLVVLGERVNALSPERWRRGLQRTAGQEKSGFWYRLSQFVMKRPLPIALASAALLLAFGWSFTRIEFTGLDATILPTSSHPRQVNDILTEEFEVNRGRQINLAVKATPADRARVVRYARELRRLPNVEQVTPPRRLSQALYEVDVVPRQRELDQRSLDLVEEIRSRGSPFPVGVAGATAEFIDQQDSLREHIPLALGVLSLITFLVLFALTGSVVLPIKTLIMNLLTVSAAFGLLVLIFQDGRFESLLGFESQGGVEATQPLLLFALSFGLSTDYAVFLLTRIKEARDAGKSDREAVAIGLERTGRIVTAAALLFCIAIGAFATSSIIFIKQIGVGTAFAVIVDATIVRALLVPSLMALLGARNWWAPGPLRRLHRRIGISEA